MLKKIDTANSICYKTVLTSGNNSVVECNLAKVEVAGSNPVSRSKEFKDLAIMVKSFFLAFEAFVSVYVSVWR